MCVLPCSATVVLCLRDGREDKGKTREPRRFGGRKVMGLWGSLKELKIVIIIFFTAVWRRLGDL